MAEKIIAIDRLNRRIDPKYLPESMRVSYEHLVKAFVLPQLAVNGEPIQIVSPFKDNSPSPEQLHLIPIYYNLFDDAATAVLAGTAALDQIKKRAVIDNVWFFNRFRCAAVNGNATVLRPNKGVHMLASDGFDVDFERALKQLVDEATSVYKAPVTDWLRPLDRDQQEQLISARIQRLETQKFRH